MNPEGLRHLFQDAGVELARRSLSRFIRDGWHQIEPATPLVHGWYVDAIAEHLEALTKGDIRKLLINVPPRHSKSSLVSVLWLPWVWLTKPATRWLFSSYALSLSLRDSVRTRRLIESPWYQSLVGGEFGIVGDQNTKAEFANEHTGYRIATSTDAGTTGKGGEFLVFDDPHNVNEAESELVRAGVLTWYDQVWSTRANDPRTVKECGIMQRVHEKDLAGHVLEHGGWTHLKLPAEFTGIKCSTSIGWSDPRVVSGELLDPVRFPREELDKLKVKLGPYGTSGQLQQEPSPAEGAIFKRAWIRHYERHEDFLVCDAEVRFRPQDCVRFATVDPAISQKDEADWFIMAAWAVFPAVRGVYVALLDLLRSRVEGPDVLAHLQSWHVRHRFSMIGVETVGYQLAIFQAARRKGLPVREISNKADAIYRVDRDKVARAYGATPLMADARFFIPKAAPWLADYINEMVRFPLGEHDDMVDATAYAVAIADRFGGTALPPPRERVEVRHLDDGINRMNAEEDAKSDPYDGYNLIWN